MKKKLLFSSIALLSCLAVLFGALTVIPHAAHAAPARSAKAAAPTISISPTTLNPATTVCTHLGTIHGQTYAACDVTVTVHGSAPKGIKITSSYTANTCYQNCTPYYDLAVLPGTTVMYPQFNSTLAIIVPDEIEHETIRADIFIAGPANTVKVHFDGYNTCC